MAAARTTRTILRLSSLTLFIANFATPVVVYRTGSVLSLSGCLFDQNTGSPPGISVGYANATVSDSTFTDNAGLTGPGAISVSLGGLTIARSAFQGNSGHSGAIEYYDGGGLTITDSTFSGNTASYRGGALSSVGGTGSITLRNSTFSGNSANDVGGAIFTDLVVPIVMNNVTITGNTCREGCGLFLEQNAATATFTLSNSIIAANGGRDCYTEGAKFLLSLGHNLIGRGDACVVTEAEGDVIGTAVAPLDARLAPLADNGGATLTHALLWNSPALDQGSPAASGDGACEPKDQIGTARPVGDGCDIGAFEGSLDGSGGGGDGGVAGVAGGAPTAEAGEGGAPAEPNDGAMAGAPPSNGAAASGATDSAAGSGTEPGDGGAGDDSGGYTKNAVRRAGDGDCGCRVGRAGGSARGLTLLGLACLLTRRRRRSGRA